jgi:hypothetical protein
LTLGVSAGFQVAGLVVGVDGGAGIGAGGLAQIAEAIDGVAGDQVARIGDLG